VRFAQLHERAEIRDADPTRDVRIDISRTPCAPAMPSKRSFPSDTFPRLAARAASQERARFAYRVLCAFLLVVQLITAAFSRR